MRTTEADAPYGMTIAAIDDDMQARKRRRQAIANTARHFRRIIQEAGNAGAPLFTPRVLNEKVRIIIGDGDPPGKVNRLAIRKEILERIANLNAARQRDVSHMYCGDDDAWYERLEWEGAYTRAMLKWWRKEYGDRIEGNYLSFFLSSDDQLRAGANVCPSCLSFATQTLDGPTLRDPWTVTAFYECLDCESEYNVTFRGDNPHGY